MHYLARQPSALCATGASNACQGAQDPAILLCTPNPTGPPPLPPHSPLPHPTITATHRDCPRPRTQPASVQAAHREVDADRHRRLDERSHQPQGEGPAEAGLGQVQGALHCALDVLHQHWLLLVGRKQAQVAQAVQLPQVACHTRTAGLGLLWGHMQVLVSGMMGQVIIMAQRSWAGSGGCCTAHCRCTAWDCNCRMSGPVKLSLWDNHAGMVCEHNWPCCRLMLLPARQHTAPRHAQLHLLAR